MPILPRSFVAIAYWLLAAVSIAVIPLGPFTALPLLRMAPTVLLAATSLRATRSRFGTTIAWGLFFGAWGDFFLATFDNSVAGLGVLAFFVGHACYITGLRRSGWHVTPLRRALVASLIVFGIGYGAVIAWINPHIPVPRLGNLAVAPVLLAYMPALIGMASVAVLRQGSRLLAAGALVFVASDAMIPLNQFLLPKAHATDLYATDWLLLSGFVTYYGAQWWIARGAEMDAGQPLG